jgi:predicted enzyme related to lactoylglutathione lyase
LGYLLEVESYTKFPSSQRRGGCKDIAGTSGGIAHFGFILVKGDLDAAIKEVRKAGGKLLERGEHEPGYSYAYVTDPDGYIIEL